MEKVSIGVPDVNQAAPLPLIAAEIRRLQKIIVEHQRSALRTSLDLGDHLSWARAQVSVRGWKAWRIEHCPDISKRTDEVYRQLAAHRDRIEQGLVVNPDLSIREALRLIRPPVEPKPKPPELETWGTMGDEAKRAGLEHDGLDKFLKYLPAVWRDELADRVARIKGGTTKDRVLSARLREHLGAEPDSRLARYIRDQRIDIKRITVHVAAIDAPSRRRPPLVQVHAGSSGVH